MVLIIVMGGNVIVFFHGGVSLLTGIAQCHNHGIMHVASMHDHLLTVHAHKT